MSVARTVCRISIALSTFPLVGKGNAAFSDVFSGAVTQGFNARQKDFVYGLFFFIVVSPLERIARQVIGIEPYRRGLRDAPC